jgi:DNA polymerase (family 10)
MYEGKLSVDNREVAELLSRIADMLEFKGENPFKVRSYRNAAEIIEDLGESVSEIVARGGAAALEKIHGIGKSLSAQIVEIVQTGSSHVIEELRREFPETVLDLLRVSGIGLKTAQSLYRNFGVKSLEDLRAFAEGGGLGSVPGLGQKTAEKIIRSLERIEAERGQMRLNEAIELARSLVRQLEPKANRLEIVGQIRRWCEMVSAIELLASGQPSALIEAFIQLPQISQVKVKLPDRVEAETTKEVKAILHIAPEENFAAAMVRTTSSEDHLRQLEALAREMGLGFEGFQLIRENRPLRLEGERELYRALGLEFIPPELREGRGEIEAARAGKMPKLIARADIRGDLHMHTDWSDGRNTIREMIEAARALGHSYIAITDHTKSSSVANGNTAEELLEEIREINQVARDYTDICVLKGAEVDILSDGSLDLPFEVLDELDWIICSIHSGFHQGRQRITDRVISAMRTGYPNAFAHPTGRLLGQRPPYEIDLEQVIEAAREHHVRLELNASPYRLDLNDKWLRVAKSAGVGIVINTDSHNARSLEDMRYGVMMARRAWLEPEDVLNSKPLEELLEELGRKKSRRGRA